MDRFIVGTLSLIFLVISAGLIVGSIYLARDEASKLAKAFLTTLGLLTGLFMGGLGLWLGDSVIHDKPVQDDPCAYTTLVGKVPVTRYHHGAITYGGRVVLCPE